MPFISGHGRSKPNPAGELSTAAPFKIDGEYCRLLPLSRGLYTIVSDFNFHWLNRWKWSAVPASSGKGFYVARERRKNETGPGTILMHRVILGLTTDDIDVVGDHRNHCGLDNRNHNLRIADHFQSIYNTRKHFDNTTGCKGVDFFKQFQKYRAMIQSEGERIFLGYFDSLEAANNAYRKAAEIYHEDFKCTD